MVACLSVVVVEDHDDLRELICEGLRVSGHQVLGLGSAEELDDKARVGPVDVFILDLNLPGEDGLSLAKRLRAVYENCGIVMVTARSRLSDKIQGYESGADVYLTKPIQLEELRALIQTFSRRMAIHTEVNDILTLKNVILSGPLGQVRLSVAEAEILTSLARAPSSTLQTWQLMEILNLGMSDTNKAALEVRIVRLRKKMQSCKNHQAVIESVRSYGYRLMAVIKVI